MSESQPNTSLSKQRGAISVAEEPSRLSGAIFLLVCAMPVFSTVAFGAVDFWALGIMSLLAGLIAVLWLADGWLKKELRGDFNRLQIPLLGLLGIGLIQLLPLRPAALPPDLLPGSAVASLSIASYSTRLAILQLLVYLVFLVAASTFVNSPSRLRKIIVTIIVFGSSMAFYGILQRFAGLEEIYGFRPVKHAFPFASFINQHHFAAFMEMTVGIALALLFGGATKKNKRIFLLVAVVIMGMAVIFTGSRGGMLSLLGVVGFIVAANILRKPPRAAEEGGETVALARHLAAFRRNFAILGGGLVVIIILFGSVLLLGGDESLLRGIGFTTQADASNGRIHFWQTALRIFRDYPILGAGLDSFGIAFSQYDTWNGAYRIEQAHNDYLQILADAGIAGFLCVAAFIFLLFKRGLRTVVESTDPFRRNAAVGALAGCCGILIHSFFDFPLRTPSNALFFLILCVLATVSIDQPKPVRKRNRRASIAAKSQT